MVSDYLSKKDVNKDILFSLGYSDTEQNRDFETKSHWREHKKVYGQRC